MLRQLCIILIALILSAIVWWVGPLVAIGIYRPLLPIWLRGTIVALLLIWGFWPVVSFLLRKIFRPPVRTVVRRKQLDRITVRFRDACLTLRHVGLAAQRTFWQRLAYRCSSRHVQDKPWYLMLGPQGSGKSSLIAGSGQQLLLSKKYGLPMTSDVGATQDCNIWMTDQAVYMDTAGSWVQQDGMDANALSAWKILLKLIRRTRRHPALDGIVLCLDASWLAQAPAIERQALTDALRARVLEIAAWFRADLPIYLLLNRLDTLPGGSSLLSAIPEKILAQGIGMTLPLNQEHDVLLNDIAHRYQEIEARLQQHVLSTAYIFDHNNDSQMPANILLGIESVSKLRPLLLDMIEQLFPQAPRGFSGKLRGVWLGSSANIEVPLKFSLPQVT
jgi:type VI secretion system protein ImpL